MMKPWMLLLLIAVVFFVPRTSPALGPIRGAGDPIVEIRDLPNFENYICPSCVPSDLAGVILPPGFSASPPRVSVADFGEVRKLPTDPDFVGIDLNGLEFQRVARVKGGSDGLEPVDPGVIVNLESDRTLRFDSGREIHELSDGKHRYVLFAASEALALDALSLPEGWSRSARVLEHDLVLFDPSGFPFVYVDDQSNLWQRLTIDPNAQVPAPQRLTGRRLDAVDVEGSPDRRSLRLTLGGDGIAVPAAGSAGDPSVEGGWLIVENPATGKQDSFALPASGWRGLGRPSGSGGWLYRDRHRANGPCTEVAVRADARISAVCKGGEVGLTFDEPSQGSLAVGLALGPVLDYCAVFGGDVRNDFGTAASGRGRFSASNTPAPEICPFLPMYRVSVDWDPSPVQGLVVRGREADAPILGRIGAVNIHTVADPEADAAYNAGVLPLVIESGAILVVIANDPDFVDTANGPATWAQPHLAMPHYPGAAGILGMVGSDAYVPLLPLKQAQVGNSLNFGFQLCLHDCANLSIGGLVPVRLSGRILAIHYTASRAAIETAAPILAEEAEEASGVRLGWAGRTIADMMTVIGGQLIPANTPLGADGSLFYELDGGVDPADVLALPELSALLDRAGAHVVVFFEG
jgi:hypothetical protein